MIVPIQQGLRAEGLDVSIAKLCRWFGVHGGNVLPADEGTTRRDQRSLCRNLPKVAISD
jgi:hypothetical protein